MVLPGSFGASFLSPETPGLRLFLSLFPGRNIDNQRGWIQGSWTLLESSLSKESPDSRLDDPFVDDGFICDNGDRAREVHHLIIQYVKVFPNWSQPSVECW